MSSIFAGKQSYAGKWQVKSVEAIPEEDQENIQSAHVVNSQYGLSVCFIMKAGNMFFIPTDNNCNCNAGDAVNIQTAKVITLEKQGEADIQRIRVE